MKKIIQSILASLLIIVSICTTLTSCLGPTVSGTYTTGHEGSALWDELEFDGYKIHLKKFRDISAAFGNPSPEDAEIVEYELSYMIKDDIITIYSTQSRVPYYAVTLNAYETQYYSEHSFEMGETYIKIGNTVYNKK